ncbi:MAG: hypothetical protein JF609_06765 [Verrucomicrobia bacterium]|nr:hypothetical protein [Verrucomicrobiota bacterium]
MKLGRAGLLSTSSFWQGPDHLLIVEVAGTVEKYRRFYFRDIQAVIIQNTRTRLWWTLGLIMVILFMLAVLVEVDWGLQSHDSPPLYFCVFVAFCLIVALTMNIMRGPTCVVQLRTAVQTQVLPNVTRHKKAAQLVMQLGPAIRAAQATPEAPAPVTDNPAGPVPV